MSETLTLSRDDWAYLAGFVDADGSISVNRWCERGATRPRYLMRLTISNCDKPIMDWLVVELGGGVCLANREGPKVHRTSWRWAVSGKYAGKILEQLLPYLRVKQKRAELAIQFADTMGIRGVLVPPDQIDKREKIVTHLARMNKRGRQR